MDLYDRDWNLLYAWTLEEPEPGIMPRILHADPQGRVYAYTESEFPQIGRYRVDVVRL